MTKRALEKADSKTAGKMRFVSFGSSLSDNRHISICVFFFLFLPKRKRSFIVIGSVRQTHGNLYECCPICILALPLDLLHEFFSNKYFSSEYLYVVQGVTFFFFFFKPWHAMKKCNFGSICSFYVSDVKITNNSMKRSQTSQRSCMYVYRYPKNTEGWPCFYYLYFSCNPALNFSPLICFLGSCLRAFSTCRAF